MSCDDRPLREVLVDPKVLESTAAPGPVEVAPDAAAEPSGERAELIALLKLLIETQLTRRQREIVDLYFYQGKTQDEIAEVLGVAQQVVSKQLFGVMRKGKRVGGAIRKLRKVLGKSGITFE